MKAQHKVAALILAGGEGRRLGGLTETQAKPAVPFAGKYRIVDFVLTNLGKSGITNVGIITQYRPFELSEYIGNGETWKINASFLPPYSTREGAEWYKGTADAVYRNLEYSERKGSDYTLIVSADQIYSCDYTDLLKTHVENNADVTIYAVKVDKKDASRFGILECNENGEITGFEEKPSEPKSDLASMGIYVYDTDKLREVLEEDEKDLNSSHDFGKDVIPNAIKNGKKAVCCVYDGYWRDVGTVGSYLDASLDAIEGLCPLSGIMTRERSYPPGRMGDKGSARRCISAGNCYINGSVERSVIGRGVRIEEGAVVKNSVIFPGALIEKAAKLDYCIVADNSVVCENSVLTGDRTSFCPAVSGAGLLFRSESKEVIS